MRRGPGTPGKGIMAVPFAPARARRQPRSIPYPRGGPSTRDGGIIGQSPVPGLVYAQTSRSRERSSSQEHPHALCSISLLKWPWCMRTALPPPFTAYSILRGWGASWLQVALFFGNCDRLLFFYVTLSFILYTFQLGPKHTYVFEGVRQQKLGQTSRLTSRLSPYGLGAEWSLTLRSLCFPGTLRSIEGFKLVKKQ